MLLDIIFAVLIVFAVLKGYQRGLIIGLFSLIAVIIGLAAAMKLSVVIADYLGKAVNISDKWMPVVSFAVVFLLVILLIRLGAKLIEKTVEMAMMGWLNKIGGIILFAAIYITVFSVLVFYAEQLKLLQQDTIDKSVAYSFIQPWGPKAINGFGSIVPLFKDMFSTLEHFFDGVATNISGK
ncbi:MAG: CvpA family protein [Chitinophagaceae bacterium]|mgnify:FL=1|nr:CvpA family protein [Chitinophagaceae bacterium]MBK8309734.1 CvpA family protein [Chitinophagaceae bacterium]MBK8606553.1 CvpA family protein [Chitinophagaceae bacterium]MBP6476148.1 CvpA family protein [Chitinophagaceae bacterium]MBP7107219.1 CvpA family protein [Chitinophagaceae bacterium]